MAKSKVKVHVDIWSNYIAVSYIYYNDDSAQKSRRYKGLEMIETNHKSINFFLLYKLHSIWQNKSTRQYLVKLFCCYIYYNDDTAKSHTEKNDSRKD